MKLGPSQSEEFSFVGGQECREGTWTGRSGVWNKIAFDTTSHISQQSISL